LPLNGGPLGNMAQRGFTLIEMAFVFVIVGLMVGGGLFALTPVIDKTRINQTSTTLDQVESSLVLFAVRFQRLPCPADGALANTDPNYGFEQPVGGAVTCTITGANAVIPWKTLGLDESYSIDGWATRISYWASGSTIAGTTTVTTGTVFNHTGNSGWPQGPFFTVTDVVSGQAVTPGPPNGSKNDQAAYVLVSHGKSKWYGFGKNGGTAFAATVAGTNKQCNSTPATCPVSANSFASGGPVGTYPPNSTKYFDDIVRWRSPAMIIQLCGSGSCGNG